MTDGTKRGYKHRAHHRGKRRHSAEDDTTWNKAVEWAAADLGFRACPIFRLDIVGVNEEGVELGSLHCYTKAPDSHTILAASKKPTQLNPNKTDLSTVLLVGLVRLVGLENTKMPWEKQAGQTKNYFA